MLLNCGAGEDSWESLGSNQSILKETSPEYSLEGLMLKLQYFGHLTWKADSLEKTLMLGQIEGRRRRGQQRMRWLDCITDSFNAHTVAVFQSPRSVWLFTTPWTAAWQASLSFTISWSCSNSCPLSQWCHPTISPSVTSFSSCPQFFPASETFPMSLLFISGGQNIGASALVRNIQGWFPFRLTGLISLLSRGLSRVFSSSIVQKHQFFSTQPSLWSSSHIRPWLLEKP